MKNRMVNSKIKKERKARYLIFFFLLQVARPRSAVSRAPGSQVRGPRFDTRSGHILSFLLPLFQEGQLSVTDLFEEVTQQIDENPDIPSSIWNDFEKLVSISVSLSQNEEQFHPDPYDIIKTLHEFDKSLKYVTI